MVVVSTNPFEKATNSYVFKEIGEFYGWLVVTVAGSCWWKNTVDGNHPAPVEGGSLTQYFSRFYDVLCIPGAGAMSSINYITLPETNSKST